LLLRLPCRTPPRLPLCLPHRNRCAVRRDSGRRLYCQWRLGLPLAAALDLILLASPILRQYASSTSVGGLCGGCPGSGSLLLVERNLRRYLAGSPIV
jgi:hypothetical protein